MSSPTPAEAEREARTQALAMMCVDRYGSRGLGATEVAEGGRRLDAYRAAIIRRCLAAVEAAPRVMYCDDEGGAGMDHSPDGAYLDRSDILAALTALLEET